jgi:hypothetical protein
MRMHTLRTGRRGLWALALTGIVAAAGLSTACGHRHYYYDYYDPPFYTEDCICDPFGCDCTIIYYKDGVEQAPTQPAEVW